jgi:hypothetical protein
MELTFYIWENDSEVGPYTLSQMRSMWSSGRMTLKSHVRQETDSDWKEAREYEIIYELGQKSLQANSPFQRVVVTDFEMSFRSMVIFMCKWAVAAIPAALILFCLLIGLAMAFGVFGAILGGLSVR